MDVLQQLDLVSVIVYEKFSSLSAAQLDWKPDPSTWSIAQCFDHLIVSNKTYFPSFEKLIYHRYKLSFFQKLNPFKKTLGPVLIRLISPQGSKKFRAPKIFRPSPGSVSSNIIQDFLRHQDEIKTVFRSLLQLDTKNLVIASPISSFITYSLADAMELIVVHEQRHVRQANNVVAHPNFLQS